MEIPEGVTKWGSSYYVDLNSEEIAELDRPVKGIGGIENFFRALQKQLNHATKQLKLSADDLTKIPHVAFDIGEGGFEGRLLKVFGRVLGPRLGRDEEPTGQAPDS